MNTCLVIASKNCPVVRRLEEAPDSAELLFLMGKLASERGVLLILRKRGPWDGPTYRFVDPSSGRTLSAEEAAQITSSPERFLEHLLLQASRMLYARKAAANVLDTAEES